MKMPGWVWSVVASLIMFGAPVYGEEAAPKADDGGFVFRLDNPRAAEHIWKEKEERRKAAEAEKAKAEEKQREKNKQERVEAVERKTGRKATSWQLQNR
jgi:hypothetical protein